MIGNNGYCDIEGYCNNRLNFLAFRFAKAYAQGSLCARGLRHAHMSVQRWLLWRALRAQRRVHFHAVRQRRLL